MVEKAKVVRKQLKELYEERNRGEGWDWKREKQGGVFHLLADLFLKMVRQIFSHCLSVVFIKVK